MKNIIKYHLKLFIIYMFLSVSAIASEGSTALSDSSTLIKASAVIIIVWFGLALFLFKIDRKTEKLRRDIDEL